jgi:predicted aminopeptidase
VSRSALKLSAFGLICIVLALVAGCSSLRYYTQAAVGGARVLLQREPIERLLARSDLEPELRRKLELVREILSFAIEELDLPDNGSYRSYVATGKQAVVWNVVAAPRYALEPRQWCFLFAGCVSYRGYFERERAERYATKLADEGWDTRVGGAAAYSTLGWFADPIFDTVLGYPDWQLAGVLFHELAHQRVYAPGDTTFSESFASFVEEEGVRLWLDATGRAPAEREGVVAALAEEERFNELMLRYRTCLARSYAEDHDLAWMAQRKQSLFASLELEYRELQAHGLLSERFDGWFARSLNNADLAAIADYTRLVPFFRALYEQQGGSFPAFFDAVEELAQASTEARRERVGALVPGAVEAVDAICP